MPLAHIEFQPKDGTTESREELEDKLSWYGACLWKDGRICDGYSTCYTDGGVRLSVYFIGRAAVSSGVKCSYTKQALAEVHKLAKSRAKWVVTKSWSELDHTTSWRVSKSLVMSAPCVGQSGPWCRSGDDWRIIPYYTLPIDGAVRERLTHWRTVSDQLYSVWLHSGVLEKESYAVLADCRGRHMVTCREFAAGIEETTCKPTYVELPRYYSYGDAEQKRRCPGCGGKWRRSADGYGLDAFVFRCDRCRLVSDDGTKDETGSWKSIGEWRAGRKPIESAASIRQRIKRGTLIL